MTVAIDIRTKSVQRAGQSGLMRSRMALVTSLACIRLNHNRHSREPTEPGKRRGLELATEDAPESNYRFAYAPGAGTVAVTVPSQAAHMNLK
jgi:hypothetical protein